MGYWAGIRLPVGVIQMNRAIMVPSSSPQMQASITSRVEVLPSMLVLSCCVVADAIIVMRDVFRKLIVHIGAADRLLLTMQSVIRKCRLQSYFRPRYESQAKRCQMPPSFSRSNVRAPTNSSNSFARRFVSIIVGLQSR